MEIKTLGDGLIYLGYVAAALGSIGLVMRYAVMRPFRSFIQREINAPLVAIQQQLTGYGDVSKRLDDHLVNHAGEIGRQHG